MNAAIALDVTGTSLSLQGQLDMVLLVGVASKTVILSTCNHRYAMC